MVFTEDEQVFLAVSWYRRLTGAFGARGEQAYIHCVRCYAAQRGRRMARRAIRDGKPLDYRSYCEYGEWAHSPAILAAGRGSVTEVLEAGPRYRLRVDRCPWHEAFEALDAGPAQALYCAHLDEAMAGAFGGGMEFHTDRFLCRDGCCVFRVERSGFAPDTCVQRRPDSLRGFDYHCAHLFRAFADAARALFGEAGEAAARQVLADCAARWGAEAAAGLERLSRQDFEQI
ncbi:MAG TPA: L-2-amino-thiazoline-4-carboxylic acid hydrolase [Candidatus Fournierella merdigallinarum]|nr:L-2-amino-thiazoline-4-carboxylic acid hydrolase [Candidatus Fournierella merdigallinarum]